MPKKHNAKGRSLSEPFVAIPRYMLLCPAYKQLPPISKALMPDIIHLYKGNNNGYLEVSTELAGMMLGASKTTGWRALKALIDFGFLEVTFQGAFSMKQRHSAEYRLTWRMCDRTGAIPSKAFMKWQPKNAPRI